MEQLEYECLSSSSWCINNDIIPRPQSVHRLLLPEIRQGELLKRWEWERHEEPPATSASDEEDSSVEASMS
jgi:hypothetical protein